MDKEGYKFRVKLGNFELEVEGDKNFVEKNMNRYEGRFLPRFQQLLDAANEALQNQPQPAERPEETGTAYGEAHHGQKRDKKSRRSRNKKQRRNTSNTIVKPAPQLPKDQVVEKEFSSRRDEMEFEEIKVFPVSSVSSTETGNENSANPANKAGLDINPSDLKEIYDRIGPRTHHEKTLVFAYYLQNRRNHGDFSSNDIRRCYREIGADPAGNISQVLNHASRSGFLNKISQGRQLKFSLTSKGRHFVEKGLEPHE